MKYFGMHYLVLLVVFGFGFGLGCQHRVGAAKSISPGREIIAEAACGQCQLGLAGDSCDLAVRIAGKAYFVDGTGIDDHGDAHTFFLF